MSFISGILNKIYTQRDGRVPVLEDPAGNAVNAQGNTAGAQLVDLAGSTIPLPSGAATESTLSTRASEATVATLATQATLATRATEATQLLVKTAAESLESALATDDAAMGTREALPAAGIYLADPSADTLDNGDAGRVLLNARRMPVVDLGTLIAGEDQTRNNLHTTPGGSFLAIATAGTNTVKTGAGTLCRIIVTKVIASGTIKVYDNTAGSGTVILNTFGCSATELNSNVPHVIEIHADFATGCTVVSVENVEFTVVYR
jgi:hypothetical protein